MEEVKAAPDQEQELASKITSLVEERLQAAQKHKEYKDEGRKDGTRKGRIAYQVISLQNLTDIEADPILAEKLTTKLKVWPEVNIEEEKASGTQSGACYLKYQYHRALAPKPFNTAESRKIYITVLTAFQELLKQAKGAKEVEETAYQVFSDKGLKLIYPDIATAEYKTKSKYDYRYYNSDKTKLIAESVFGKSFINLVRKSYGSQAVQQKFFNARLYDPFSEDQATAYLDRAKAHKQKQVERQTDEIEAIRTETDPKVIFSELRWHYAGMIKLPEFQKESLEKWKEQIIKSKQNYLNRYLADPIKIPVQYQARGESWAWAYEKKEAGQKKKSDLPAINTGKYASRLIRKNGLKVAQIGTKGVKETWGLAAVQYGNGLNDKESEILTYFLNGAFQDLAEILNINLAKINSIGTLGLDFATRGKAGSSATYWPDYKVINLNKRSGDGTLAHEWGHFLDNCLSIEVAAHDQEKLNGHFGALATRHRAADPEIDQLLRGLISYIVKGNGTETVKRIIRKADNDYVKGIEDKGGYDATLNYYKQQYKYTLTNVHRFDENIQRAEVFKALLYKFNVDEIELDLPINSSYQYYYSSKCGNKKYWCSNVELFARAFEMYVNTKLTAKGMQNNFLQQDLNYWRELLVFPYPAPGPELETTNNYFDTLFNLIRTKFDLQPLPGAFSGERVTEDLVNSTLSAKDTQLEESPEEEQEPEETTEEKQEEVLEVIAEEKASEPDQAAEPAPETMEVKTHTYQLGDKYRSDFDTDGMLDKALDVTENWPITDLLKLYTSLESLNYHTQNAHLARAIDNLRAADMRHAYIDLAEFRKSIKEAVYFDAEPDQAPTLTTTTPAPIKDFKFSTQTNWNNTPELFRKTVKISPAKKFDFENFEELYKALKPMLGTDELRPVMSGIFFDSTAGEIAATDAHKLIRIKHPTTRSGIYTLNKAKSIEPIEGQYMRYNAVIPTKDFVISGPVDVENVLTYLSCASYFANRSAHTVQFIAGDQKIGFNGEFLTEVITAMVKLGVKEFTGYYQAPNRAFLLRGKSGEAEIMGLTMPQMLHDESKALGSSDLDFAFELNSCLNIFTNELTSMQPTGKVTTEPIKTIDTPGGQGSLSPEMIKAIYQGRVKNHTLPILDYACITGGNLLLYNLDTFVKLPVSGIADGIYNITDAGLLKENSYNVEDFTTLNFIEDNKEGKETPGPTLSPADLESMLLALNCTGKDELRPGFTAINLLAKNDKLTIGSTDQHVLYVDRSSTPAADLNVNVTVNPFFNFWLAKLQGPAATSFKNERINLSGKNFTINQRLIDFKFPDLLNYISKDPTTKVSFTKPDYKELLKAARANTKAGLYFDFKNNLVTLKDGTLKTKEVKFTVTERSPEILKFSRLVVCMILMKNKEQENDTFVNDFGFGFENFNKLEDLLPDAIDFYYTPGKPGGIFVLADEKEEDTRKILPLDPAVNYTENLYHVGDSVVGLKGRWKGEKLTIEKAQFNKEDSTWIYTCGIDSMNGGTITLPENSIGPAAAPEPDQDPTDLIEALKIAYEVDPDPDTLELIEALELAAEYN